MTIKLIELFLTILERGPAALMQLIKIGRQTGELTAEQEAEYTRRQEAAFAAPHWQPEKRT